jgi:hypothetical protein
MKIVMCFLSLGVVYMSFCGCSERQVDPLTSPIQEVLVLQNKIEAKIKNQEDYYKKKNDELIADMRKAEADHSLSSEEIGTYTQSIQQLAIKEENSIEKIKEQLPSNMLVNQYNEIIEKYLKIYLSLDRIQSVDPDDFDVIKKITRFPQDFGKSAGTICLALPHGRDE